MKTNQTIKDYLSAFKTSKGQPYTHSSLDGGCYNVPASALETFIEKYKFAYKHMDVLPLHILEKHEQISPVLIDLDFRQATPERCYTIDSIVKFALAYSTCIKELVCVDFITFFIQEKGTCARKTDDPNMFKDGVHIIAPSLVIDSDIQLAIRDIFISNETNFFADFGFCNPIEDILDESVMKRNNWLMYGSNKPTDGDLRYLVTHRIQVDLKHNVHTCDNIDYPQSDRAVERFSIRNRTESNNYTDRGMKILSPQPQIKDIDTDCQMSVTSDNKTINQCELKILSDTELACALVDILSPKRADNYDNWIQLGFCLHNINKTELLKIWIDFSKQSIKYNPGECNKLWSNMNTKSDGLKMGTLKMWAKQDNPQEYEQIVRNNLIYFVFKSKDGSHHDVANVVYNAYGNIYKCVSITKSIWYEFRNHRWHLVEQAYTLRKLISSEISMLYYIVAKRCQEKAIEIAQTNPENADAYIKKVSVFNNIATKLKNTGFKDSIIKECAELCYDGEFMEKLDSNPHLIVFENGVYDLTNMRFREGIPEDCASYTTKYDYSNQDIPEVQNEIKAFMNSISPDAETAEYTLKICAYLLSGVKYLEHFWFWTGKGRNGKGTLATLLDGSFGNYYYEPDISIVTTTKKCSSGANPELAKSKGKRILCASEPDDEDKASKFRVNKLKAMRGNDYIQARGLFKDFIEFRPQFGMIFQMNDKPDLSKADDAIGSTLKIIEFPWQFVSDPKEDYQRKSDTTIKDKFKSNVSYHQQFFRLLIEYYAKYVLGNKSITEPSSVTNATKEYMEDNNPVAVWLNEHYQFTGSKDDMVAVETLYDAFKNNSKSDITKIKFGRFMSLLKYKSEVVKGNKRYYKGLKLVVNENECMSVPDGDTASHAENCFREALEQALGYAMPKVRPAWLRNPKTGCPMELDFFDADRSIAIEYDGPHHYEYPNKYHKTKQEFNNQQERDKNKERLCKDHGICIIRVKAVGDTFEEVSGAIKSLMQCKECRC
jgi:P4 family phage/plasmid primase-like protien